MKNIEERFKVTYDQFVEKNPEFILSSYSKAKIEDWQGIYDKFFKIGSIWIQEPSRCSLFLSGPSGTGKTHFSHCLLRGIFNIERQIVPMMITSKDLDDAFLKSTMSESDQDSRKITSRAPKESVLFIDDLGSHRCTERSWRDFMELIDKRNRNDLITVISSNYRVEELYNQWIVKKSGEQEDDIMAKRIESRMSSSFIELDFTPVQDMRMKTAKTGKSKFVDMIKSLS